MASTATTRRSPARKRSPRTPKASRTPRTSARLKRIRGPLLALAAFRGVLGVIAIFTAPFLFDDHYLWVVLMRPTKEVLLFGGFLARQGDVNMLHITIAAVPLSIFGVWHAFLLGRAYSAEIKSKKLPGIAGKIIRVERIQALTRVLKRKGPKLVFLGRLAVFPSSVTAMAAGSSGMPAKRFFLVDGLGGLLAIAEVLGAGYALGHAYKNGKMWITGLGIAALLAFGVILGRAIRRDGKRDRS